VGVLSSGCDDIAQTPVLIGVDLTSGESLVEDALGFAMSLPVFGLPVAAGHD
jgi:hypothetical protein